MLLSNGLLTAFKYVQYGGILLGALEKDRFKICRWLISKNVEIQMKSYLEYEPFDRHDHLLLYMESEWI